MRRTYNSAPGIGIPLVMTGLALLALNNLVHVLNGDDGSEKPDVACTYLAQPGDTLSSIANGRSSVTDALYEANGNTASINPGDVLRLGQSVCASLEETGVAVVPVKD